MRDYKKMVVHPHERILWLCVALERFVGTNDFEHARLLQMGMLSIQNSAAAKRCQLACFNLRLMALGLETPISVTRAIEEYLSHHHTHRTRGEYTIDPQTKRFAPNSVYGSDRLDEIERILSQPLPYKVFDTPVADTSREFRATVSTPLMDITSPIAPIAAPLPPFEMHSATSGQKMPIDIPIDELFQIAEEMDAIDDRIFGKMNPEFEGDDQSKDDEENTTNLDEPVVGDSDARRGRWKHRLTNALILERQGDALVPSTVLQFHGIKHLLGLPGVGKTSLLMAVALWMSRHDRRMMVVFPTVEVSRQYLTALALYGAKVGLLVGQSSKTYGRHAERIAETISANSPRGGFGYTIDGAEYFASNCALQGFATDSVLWLANAAPCINRIGGRSLQQTVENGKRLNISEVLCPVFPLCGRRMASRELVRASVWVGHIRSMDTPMSAYTSELDMRHYEYIARHFDLVVFDEADAVQSNLDAAGASKENIIGNSEDGLVASKIGWVTMYASGENNHHYTEAQEFLNFSSYVTRSSGALHRMLRNMRDLSNQSLAADHFAGQMITPLKILSEILSGLEGQVPFPQGARRAATDTAAYADNVRLRALLELWEHATDSAFREKAMNTVSPWTGAGDIAKLLKLRKAEVEEAHDAMRKLLIRYLAEDRAHRIDDVTHEIAKRFSDLCFGPVNLPPPLVAAFNLLVPVSLLILSYRQLRIISMHRQIGGQPLDFGDGQVSDEMLRLIPASLLGATAGLKYEYKEAESGRQSDQRIDIEYSTIRGIPRAQMLYFHRLFEPEGVQGPAVLLVSATSFLHDSPSYHIDVGPHYLLERRTPVLSGSRSIWRFTPVPNPDAAPGSPAMLSFSGAGQHANKNLREMVSFFLKDGLESEVFRALRTFDVRHGVQRKAAFIVNSYAQARMLKQHINKRHPEIAGMVKAIVKRRQDRESPADYATPSEVEKIGDDASCRILIFPMAALGRGINVVFTHGLRRSDAAIGALYFLTRPHPTADDMQLLLGLIARAGMAFSDRTFDDSHTLGDIQAEAKQATKALWRDVVYLLQEPLVASRLPRRLRRAFTANLMVNILQTIGRATRNNCPALVHFVDAKWAPNSAAGKADSAQSSMLLEMRSILEECMVHQDPVFQYVYRALYQEFLTPMQDIEGLTGGASPPSSSYEEDEENDDDMPYNDSFEEGQG